MRFRTTGNHIAKPGLFATVTLAEDGLREDGDHLFVMTLRKNVIIPLQVFTTDLVGTGEYTFHEVESDEIVDKIEINLSGLRIIFPESIQ